MSQASRSGSGLAIAALRLVLGLLFLTVWLSNLHKGLYNPGPYRGLIHGYVQTGDAPHVWKQVMSFAARHAVYATKIQLVSELAFGVLLVLGLATRPVAVAAGLFLSSLWLSEIGVPHEWIWSLVFPALVSFYLALVSAGRYYGLDAVFLSRPPLRRLPGWARG